MLSIFFIFNLFFVIYFIYVGVWYFALFPVIFTLLTLLGISGDEKGQIFDKEKIVDTIMTNLAFIAWSLINLGVRGIFKGFSLVGISAFDVAFNLLFLNIFLRLASYIVKYRDGIKIFQLGYFLTILLVLLELFSSTDFNTTINIFFLFIAFTFAIYSFINFIIGLYKKIFFDKMNYVVFLLFNITILILIYAIANDNLYAAVLYCQFYISFLYFFIFLTKRYDQYISKAPEEIKITLDDVLKRKEKPIAQKQPYKFTYLIGLNNFFYEMPQRIKLFLSFSNIILVGIQIYLFILNIYHGGGQNALFYEMFYWIGLILFYINFLTLKVIDYYYYIQRIFVFFILNFGIYLSIINFFGGNFMYIVLIGVSWNIFNNIIIFSTQKLKEDKILMKEDYYFWITANVFAMLVNIYFIFRLFPNFFMALSLVGLYIGIQLFLSFYNIRFIEKN